MWLLALALLADTVHTFSLALSPAESVAVTVTGTGDPVVLVPGLFGSAFGYRAVIPLLTDAGYRAIVVEPLGIGSSARQEHADYSLTAQADRIAAAPPWARAGAVVDHARPLVASIEVMFPPPLQL